MIKTLKENTPYENSWIRLHVDDVEFSNGAQGVYAYTERKDSGPMIIPVTAEGKLVLLKEWRYPIRDWTYCFPFGGVETDEDSLTAAKRELQEETGYVAAEWISLGSIKIDPGANSQVTPVFLARNLTLADRSFDAIEDHEVLEMSLDEIEDKISNGGIDNGWLLAGLAKYKVFLVNC